MHRFGNGRIQHNKLTERRMHYLRLSSNNDTIIESLFHISVWNNLYKTFKENTSSFVTTLLFFLAFTLSLFTCVIMLKYLL